MSYKELEGFEGDGGVKDCSRLGDVKFHVGMRVQVMRDDLWFWGVTTANRNVGHDGISPGTRLCYLQKDYSASSSFPEVSKKEQKVRREI